MGTVVVMRNGRQASFKEKLLLLLEATFLPVVGLFRPDSNAHTTIVVMTGTHARTNSHSQRVSATHSYDVQQRHISTGIYILYYKLLVASSDTKSVTQRVSLPGNCDMCGFSEHRITTEP